MIAHPSADRLDALAAGDKPEPVVREHLQQCAECRAYIDQGQAACESFRQSDEPAFLKKMTAPTTNKKGTLVFFFAPFAAVAAAALIWLLFRTPSQSVPRHEPLAALDPPSELTNSDRDRFKGSLHLALIVERDGVQSRLIDGIGIRPFDRVRLEIVTDQERPLAAGALTRNGQWVSLLPPTVLAKGIHYSDQSIRFDDHPDEGWIVVGSPDAVDKAQKTGHLDDVLALAFRPQVP